MTRSVTKNEQQKTMEGRVGNLEQSVHTLSEVQQEVMARLTKILEKLSTQGGTRREEGETSHGKRH